VVAFGPISGTWACRPMSMGVECLVDRPSTPEGP
jgi:hypothetical protein